MNKKLIFAMGLTAMMVACSSEDVLTDVQNSQESDLFAGIEKVDAQFNMGAESRLATEWGLEVGDRVGFAWLKDNDGVLTQTGAAYQNHPLNAVSESTLRPETSIYVGEYFTYYPYDESVVSIDNINFAIPAKQDLLMTWNAMAKNAIFISPKWTSVSYSIYDDGEPGISKSFKIYPAQFSNGARLNLDYKNNKVDLKDETNNDEIYASDPQIFDVTVSYLDADGNTVSINAFEYAPTVEPNVNNWEAYMLGAEATTTATAGPRAVTQPTSVEGIKNMIKGGFFLEPSTDYVADRNKTTGNIFRFHALPAVTEVGENTLVNIVINTTYGCITITKPVNEIAYTLFTKNNATTSMDQPDGVTTDKTGANLPDGKFFTFAESFVQVLGKNGEFRTEVDFSTAVMNGMHVRDDAHLLQLLRFYRDYKLGTEYEESKVNLYLDKDADGEFKISKTSIALMQSINTVGTNKVALHVCSEHGNPTVVVFNNGTDKEVPSFNKVFAQQVAVELEAQAWTWNNTANKNTGNVTTIYNRGDLTVASTEVKAGNPNAEIFEQLVNREGASITFTASVATLWKVNLSNDGTITIPATAHMRVYANVLNNVTELIGVRAGKMGVINNDGVLGAVEDQSGTIYNYGKIFHNAGAKTFITSNEEDEDFSKSINETKIGIIEMKEADANVSVSNTSSKGIITYKWSKEDAVYASPAIVRYNYLIVEGNIEFTENEEEIRYLEIAGSDVYVTNKGGYLKKLQGVIVNEGAALNITEGNKLNPAKAAYIKGYVYNGGEFTYAGDVETYFGGVSTDKENILKWQGF